MKDERPFLRELIVASIGAAIVGITYLAIEKTTAKSLYAIVAALASAGILIFLVMFFSQRTAVESYRNKLRLVGVSNIHLNYHESPTIEVMLTQAKDSVDFLGISARTFFEAAHIEETVRKRIREGVNFRFLILNPDSAHLTEKASMEGDIPEAWKADIRASIARLKALQANVGGSRVQVKTYDVPPLWRAFFLDKTTAYVNYYPPGYGGKDTPIMIIENNDVSLFHPLFGYFNYLWETAKTA